MATTSFGKEKDSSSPASVLPFKKRERFLKARLDIVVDNNSIPPSSSSARVASLPLGSSSTGPVAAPPPESESNSSSFWFEKNTSRRHLDDSTNESVLPPVHHQQWEAIPFSCHHLQQIAADMGMPPLALYLSKQITGTDADHNAHRYQLTSKDIRSVQALQELKRRAMGRPDQSSGGGGGGASSPQPAVPVKVLDKYGKAYDMNFSHNSSTDYCRIIGRDWTRFLDNTAMRRGETMLLYGSHNGRGDHLFALCNI